MYTEEKSETTLAKEKLVEDLRVVISDAETLLRDTAGMAGEKFDSIRKRATDNLRLAKLRVIHAEAALRRQAVATAKATDTYVHEEPWKAVGIAAGVGLLIGFLMGRR